MDPVLNIPFENLLEIKYILERQGGRLLAPLLLKSSVDHGAIGGNSIFLLSTIILRVRQLHVYTGVSIVLRHLSSNVTYNIIYLAAVVKQFCS